MLEAPCIACRYGQHDNHIEWPYKPEPGIIGGHHCPCQGECERDPKERTAEMVAELTVSEHQERVESVIARLEREGEQADTSTAYTVHPLENAAVGSSLRYAAEILRTDLLRQSLNQPPDEGEGDV